jgi:hypothetical protein
MLMLHYCTYCSLLEKCVGKLIRFESAYEALAWKALHHRTGEMEDFIGALLNLNGTSLTQTNWTITSGDDGMGTSEQTALVCSLGD